MRETYTFRINTTIHAGLTMEEAIDKAREACTLRLREVTLSVWVNGRFLKLGVYDALRRLTEEGER